MNTTTYKVCTDCWQIEACGGVSFLDEIYGEHEALERLEAIECGYDRMLKDVVGYVVAGKRTDSFSKLPCECCDSTLHGVRYALEVIVPTKGMA